MDDPDKIEQIVREIATKHGIAVSRDDPILILQTINNRLLLDSANAQQLMLDRYKEELEMIALRWGNDAREKAERILNASLAASKQTMGLMLEEAARKTAETVAAEIELTLARVVRPLQDARRVALLNLVAAVITTGAAATTLWVALN